LERLRQSGHRVWAWSGREVKRRGAIALQPVELTDACAVNLALELADPEMIIHAAAIASQEAARVEPERTRRVNVVATEQLAAWCLRHGRAMVYTSTDLVFDGRQSWYREDARPAPVSVYGRTKHEAEAKVLQVPGGLVARLSLLYGPSRSGRLAYFDRVMEGLRRGEPQHCFEDEFRTPLDYTTAAEALLRLATSGVAGLVHVGGRERLSRFELVQRSARALGLDPRLVVPIRRNDAVRPEARPADVSLDTTRLSTLLPSLGRPTIEEALAQ
jgi:dTDP-4-dehydrorhamnose reductase